MSELKKRSIQINLSDQDLEKVLDLCGRHQLTIGNLVSHFLSDLVYGDSYLSGSDERDYANRYYDRTCAGRFAEKTILSYLLSEECDPETEFLNYLDNIERLKKEKEHLEKYPEEALEGELEDIIEELEGTQEAIDYRISEWKKHGGEGDLPKEIELIQKWVDERNELLHKEEDE